MKEKVKKVLCNLLTVAMVLTLCIISKIEVKAVETRASTPIPVSVYGYKTVSVTDGYASIEAYMYGTMTRSSTGTVISYDVDFDVYHNTGKDYYVGDILILSETVTKSGKGIIGTVKFSYDLIKQSNGLVIHNDVIATIEISCGV